MGLFAKVPPALVIVAERSQRADLESPRSGQVWVDSQCLVEQFDRPLSFCEAVRQGTCLRIEVIGRQVVGRLCGDSLPEFDVEVDCEGASDRFRHFALDREDVVQFPVVILSPDVSVLPCIDQLDRDPDLVTRATHTALKDVRNAQLSCDLRDFLVRVLVYKNARPRDDQQVRNLRESRQDVLMDARCEKRVLLRAAQVVERQDRDRCLCR